MTARSPVSERSQQLARLRKIIGQERAQGCQDRLVIGGLAGLVRNLCRNLAEHDQALNQFVSSASELVDNYAALRPRDRDERLASLLAVLATVDEGATTASLSHSVEAPPTLPDAPPAPPPPTVANGRAVGARTSNLSLDPGRPVTDLPFVGEGRARLLARLRILTIRDVLYHLPVRHDDFTRTPPISGLVYGQLQTVIGRFSAIDSSPVKGGRIRIVARLTDDSGSIRCTWFWPAQMARGKRFPTDERVVVSGKVGQFNGLLTFEQPDYEPADADLLHVGRLVPIYGATDGLYQKQLRSLARAALAATATTLQDTLPMSVRRDAQLLPLHEALRQAHFPANEAERHAGRHRLALDELLLIQLGMQQRRLAVQNFDAPAIPRQGPEANLVDAFVANLPFRLTNAQQVALNDVLNDLGATRPMSRLIQGDVGSGKTVIAAAAMLAATTHGYQAAIMAPTEILAEQHARTLTSLFDTLPSDRRPRVELLKGGLSARQKRDVKQQIADGTVQVVAGTQAVIQNGVAFSNLALAIVDEQHRFGVAQRARLREHGSSPHLLVMTATPIPRSLALTLHGDLDVTVINEMPPGRKAIETRFLPGPGRHEAYALIRSEVAAGRQAFIVCSLVDESETIEARAATAEHDRLQREVFSDLRLGLLHGRMRPRDKELVMRQFRDGEFDILVSTAVIEVGIDVANATVMLIDGAERFGLAQLHQFRGRVGRGSHSSYCLLLSDDASERAGERLQLMVDTRDGFALAEHDLRLRGPGEFFGTRQSGLPPLRVAALGDLQTIELAQKLAAQLLASDPSLKEPQHQLLATELNAFWAAGVGDVS